MSPPYMPFYPADYLADTSHLSTLEHGAYLLLIMHYWRCEGLPDDDGKLARICRLDARQWKKVRPTIRAFFGDAWAHQRIDEELKFAHAKSIRRQQAGAAGGTAKALKSKEPDVAIATGLLPVCSSNALASSSEPEPDVSSLRSDTVLATQAVGSAPAKRRKPTNGAIAYHPDFELLWREFPFQANASKKDAYTAWLRLPEEDRDKCLDGAMSYAEWLEGERRKRPDYPGKHLSTFINGRSFDTLLEIRA